MAKQYSITKVSNEAFNEADALARFNTPLDEIQTAINELASNMETLAGKCSVVYEHAPITGECVPGTLVYYGAELGRFAPARADLRSTPGSQGESVEADCARVIGMVIKTEGGNTHGTLLCGGYWEDLGVIQACIGTDAVAGTYYLSPFDAGKAVTADALRGRLQQGVLTYLGDGKFFMGLHYLAHDNHWHGSYVLAGGWRMAADAPNGVSVPVGYQFWYDMSVNEDSAALGELSSRTTAVFYNGLLQRQGEAFYIDANGLLWYAGAVYPADNTVTVFNSYPFAYNHALVRTISSANDALTVSNRNGAYILSQNDFVADLPARSALAVSAIAGRTLRFTPVITGIAAGPGMNVQLAADGVATVSLSSLIGALHDAYVIDHNGTNQANDGVYPYIMFPRGRTSSLTFTMPVAGIPSTTTLGAHVWVMGMSPGSYTTVTRWLPDPGTGTYTQLRNVATVSGNVNVSRSEVLSYVEADRTIEIQGSGTLVTTMSVTSSPSADCKLFRIGYRFELLSAEVEDAGSGAQSSGNGGAVVNSARAAYDGIGKHVVVRASAGGLVVCGSGNVENANECVGVTLSSHADANGMIEYISEGVISDTAFNYTPGDALYVGPSGNITTINPASDSGAKFIQRIGTALSRTVVQISIDTSVIKE